MNEVALTKVQQQMFERLQKEKIVHINSHHMSGGRYEWANNPGELCSYRVFWSVISKLKLRAMDYVIKN